MAGALARELVVKAFESLAPAPISPVFLPGGSLAGLNEDLTLFCAVLALLFIVDMLLLPRVLTSPKSRWFALHALANAVIAASAAPDVARALLRPIAGLTGAAGSMLPNAGIAAIHVYHVLFFKLTADDIFHHVRFVAILSTLAIVFKHDGGASINFGAFFLCGLPGGINYVLLVAVKERALAPLTQKLWDARINTWLRAPPMSVFAFMQWQVWLAGVRSSPWLHPAAVAFFTIVVAGLHFFNGFYFAEQSIGNYHATKVRLEMAAATAATGEGVGGKKAAAAAAGEDDKND